MDVEQTNLDARRNVLGDPRPENQSGCVSGHQFKNSLLDNLFPLSHYHLSSVPTGPVPCSGRGPGDRGRQGCNGGAGRAGGQGG